MANRRWRTWEGIAPGGESDGSVHPSRSASPRATSGFAAIARIVVLTRLGPAGWRSMGSDDNQRSGPAQAARGLGHGASGVSERENSFPGRPNKGFPPFLLLSVPPLPTRFVLRVWNRKTGSDGRPTE